MLLNVLDFCDDLNLSQGEEHAQIWTLAHRSFCSVCVQLT